jgi:hypothetical protein
VVIVDSTAIIDNSVDVGVLNLLERTIYATSGEKDSLKDNGTYHFI